MLRTVASVIAGYAAIGVLFLATDVLAGALHGGRQLFAFLNLAVALPYGVAGGYITARISRGNPASAAIGLCLLAAAVSVLTLSRDPGRQPLWYAGALLALIVAGVLAAAQLHRRRLAAAA